LKIPSKFDFRLGFSDFNKTFLLWVQYMEIYLWCFFEDFYITYSLKSFLKGHVLNLKSQFLRWNILAPFEQQNICREEFWKSILHKSFKTNVRISTNFDEWKQQVFPFFRHVWIHSSSRVIWMLWPLGVKFSPISGH
jgi:hypothetical protein